MSDISTHEIRCKGVIGGDRVLLSMRHDHDYATLVLSAEMALQLRDDLIAACQKLEHCRPLTITQTYHPDGTVTFLYGWPRENPTPPPPP